MTPTTLSPADARIAIDAGARLVDIRGTDEYAREHIRDALNLPLERIGDLVQDESPVVFHCRSGMRTAANARQLADAAHGAPAYILDGGIDAWRGAGHPTVVDRAQPLDMMRQVQITAGALVLAGVVLGLFVSPAFFGVSAFIGAGLTYAGATGWCGMTKVVRLMPWNWRVTA
ncbi:rhodanese family protein [Sphingomonas sp. PAMC 26605]|uniref:rhodanese family protein n=1 Tax=Sphingomonas sp. PAMC 26605 TaxID=1112214 RepID=UPI00026CC620|nr:rhodanese family protein [Sphingomonas sp. PAMC 26605]